MNKAKLIYKTQIQRLFRPFYGGIGHVLMFHKVSNTIGRPITKGLQISQNQLDNIIKYFISRNIDIISLDELYLRLKSGRRDKRFVTFTFDDGYIDNLSHALPVFEKYDAPFSVFITTGCFEDKPILWWYLLEELIYSQNSLVFYYNSIRYDYDLKNDEQKKVAFSQLKVFLLSSTSLDDYNQRIESIFDQSNFKLKDFNRKLILSREQVRELNSHPLVTIGAHTVNHLALNKLSQQDIEFEINESVRILESITGQSIEYFAYPYGTEDEVGLREFEIAGKCNLKMAFTTQRKNVHKKQSNELYSIPRIGINSNMDIEHVDLFMEGFSLAINKFYKI